MGQHCFKTGQIPKWDTTYICHATARRPPFPVPGVQS